MESTFYGIEKKKNKEEVVVDWEVNHFTINTDLRGSTTNIIRPDGSRVLGYVYDEFGNQIKTEETDFLNDATYTGAIHDSEIGLTYMNSRYYDSSSGRFISQDSYKSTLTEPQTQHLYSYTSNNPINFIDPTGHKMMNIGNAAGSSSRHSTTNDGDNVPCNTYIKRIPVNFNGVFFVDAPEDNNESEDKSVFDTSNFTNKKLLNIVKLMGQITGVLGDVANDKNDSDLLKAIGRVNWIANLVIGVGVGLWEGKTLGVALAGTILDIAFGAVIMGVVV